MDLTGAVIQDGFWFKAARNADSQEEAGRGGSSSSVRAVSKRSTTFARRLGIRPLQKPFSPGSSVKRGRHPSARWMWFPRPRSTSRRNSSWRRPCPLGQADDRSARADSPPAVWAGRSLRSDREIRGMWSLSSAPRSSPISLRGREGNTVRTRTLPVRWSGSMLEVGVESIRCLLAAHSPLDGRIRPWRCQTVRARWPLRSRLL